MNFFVLTLRNPCDNVKRVMNHKLAALLLSGAAALAPALLAQAPSAKIDKVQLEAALRHIELWIPEVQAKLDDPAASRELPGFYDVVVHLSYNGQSIDQKYLVSGDGKKIVKGDIYDVGRNPFQNNIDKIKTDLQPSYGDAKAPITAVIFGDFECPLCKQEAEAMRPNLTKTFPGKVKVVFKDFPLEQIHPWARAASIAGRCIYRQDPQAFWKYHDWVYGTQSDIKPETLSPMVLKWAGENGVDGVQLGRCMDTKATESDVNKNIAEGRSLGVDATPTMYLNGRKIVGAMGWPEMQKLLQFEIDHQAKADDKCCTVEIPSLAPKN
jgi:protein-disulfide isomerase